MNKKILLLILSLFLLSMFANTVSAQDGDLFESVVGFFRESTGLKFLTVDLASDFSSGSPSAEAQAIAKVLFMLLFFTVLFGASSLAPGIKTFDKRLRISITFLVALIAGLTIPATWLSFVVQTYGGLFILGMLLVPAVILLYANFKWVEGDDRGTQFVKFMFMAALLFVFQHVRNVVGGMDIGILKLFAGAAEIVFGFLMFWYLVIGVIFGKSEEAREKVKEEEGLLGKLLKLGKKPEEPKTIEEKAKKEIKKKAGEEAKKKVKEEVPTKTVPDEKRSKRRSEFENKMLGYLEKALMYMKMTYEMNKSGDIASAKKTFGNAKRQISFATTRGVGFLQNLLKDVSDSTTQNEIKAVESELLRLHSVMKKTDIKKNAWFLDKYKDIIAKYISSITALMKKIKVY